jgi:dephospho-CoA kinase
MFLVGLTGGIGSGKSTVAAWFAERGCPVIDADQVAREVVERGEPALDELVERFGRGIVRKDGSLDRPALAAVVFGDAEARAEVEQITHPRVAARIAERIAELAVQPGANPTQLVIIDHPLLVETDQASRFDAVVVVLAPEQLRVARLRDERGMDPRDAKARIRVQSDDAARRAVADHVIDNGGDLASLRAQIADVHGRLLETAHARIGG